jgi:glycosyltransferase involved in cell wall biosynthesis
MNQVSHANVVPLVGYRRPFFSVIVCTYQRAELLPRALDSLLAQDEPDWEMVVVDDGSTDATADVIQRYGSRLSNMRYLWHSNRGTGLSRNAGVQAATGLFVTFLDSDDEYRTDHLSSRKQMLVDNPTVEFLHGGVQVIGDPWVADKDDPTQRVHINDCVVGGTFVVRRDVLLRLGGFDAVRYADDALFHARAQEAGIVVAVTDHASYIYHRDTPDSLCSTYGTT